MPESNLLRVESSESIGAFTHTSPGETEKPPATRPPPATDDIRDLACLEASVINSTQLTLVINSMGQNNSSADMSSSESSSPVAPEEKFVSEAKGGGFEEEEEIGEWDKPGAGCRPCW